MDFFIFEKSLKELPNLYYGLEKKWMRRYDIVITAQK